MADKTIGLATNLEVSQTLISTAGTINAGVISVVIDDATSAADIAVLFEKAKVVAMDYYLKR
jgi:hypothetical protein